MLQTTSYCQLQTFIIRNRSHKNILNKRGPTIDPCGTPTEFLPKNYILSLFLFFPYDLHGKGITFSRPTAPGVGAAPRPHLLFYGPRPNYFFAALMYQNLFFTAPNYQSYCFTALLVENISCISVFSKFQFFQLKEDKICN